MNTSNFKLPDFAKIFVVLLVGTSLWFYVLYPSLESALLQNYFVFFLIWTLMYTFIAWKIIKNESNTPTNLTNNSKYFFILLLVLFNWDLLQFPYLLSTTGILENLPVGAQISSDVFIYKILPSDLPESIKYGVIYSVIPAISFTLIAVLVKNKKAFNDTIGRGF